MTTKCKWRCFVHGFSRLDLCAVLAAIGLVTILVLPALADNRSRSGQLICLNNLRLLGRALMTWQAEHGGSPPWRTDVSSGGTFVAQGATAPPWISLRNNAWFQYSLLSNEVASPRILTCPSDIVKPARDFSASPDGGLIHANYRNNALSYFVGLDGAIEAQNWILAGDRDIGGAPGAVNCASGVVGNHTLPLPVPSSFAWRNRVHRDIGNFLFFDGRALAFPSGISLRNAVSLYASDAGSAHLLIP